MTNTCSRPSGTVRITFRYIESNMLTTSLKTDEFLEAELLRHL